MRIRSMLIFGLLMIACAILVLFVVIQFRIRSDHTQSSPTPHATLKASTVAPVQDQASTAWQMFKDFVDQVQNGGDGIGNWESACDAFPHMCDHVPGGMSIQQIELKEAHAFLPESIPGSSFESGDSVVYSPLAITRLASCKSADHCDPSSIQFEPGDKIARISWYSLTKTNCTPVRVFDPAQNSGYFQPIAIRTIGTPACGRNAVDVSSFLNQNLDDATRKIFRNHQGLKPSPSDDTVIMVAFHLMEMQEDGWHWATFWWSTAPGDSGDPSKGFACANPSPCLTGEPWNHYVMNTAVEAEGVAPFVEAANPYLDAGPVHSNCIVCHSFAMAPNCAGSPTSACPPKNLADAIQNPGGNCGGQKASDMTQISLVGEEKSYQAACRRESTDQVWSIAEYTLPKIARCNPYNCGEASNLSRNAMLRNHGIKNKLTKRRQ